MKMKSKAFNFNISKYVYFTKFFEKIVSVQFLTK